MISFFDWQHLSCQVGDLATITAAQSKDEQGSARKTRPWPWIEKGMLNQQIRCVWNPGYSRNDYFEKPVLPKRLLFIYAFEGWGIYIYIFIHLCMNMYTYVYIYIYILYVYILYVYIFMCV